MTLIPQSKVKTRIDAKIGKSGYLLIPLAVVKENNIDTSLKYFIYSDSEFSDILYFLKGNGGTKFHVNMETSRINMRTAIGNLSIPSPSVCTISTMYENNEYIGFKIKLPTYANR